MVRSARTGHTIHMSVSVRFPDLPRVSDLEFEAAWPVEQLQRWLTLARLVLSTDDRVCLPAPPAASSVSSPRIVPAAPVLPVPAASSPMAAAPQAAAPSGDELRQRRLQTGLSQAQVAAAAGLSRSYVMALERGRRSGPLASASRAHLVQTLARLAPGPATTTAAASGARTGRRA